MAVFDDMFDPADVLFIAVINEFTVYRGVGFSEILRDRARADQECLAVTEQEHAIKGNVMLIQDLAQLIDLMFAHLEEGW